MRTDIYFKELEENIHKVYAVGKQARAKGLDPVGDVEVPIATTLAEKVVGLISTVYPQLNTPSIIHRILELEKQYGALDAAVCLKIAEEVAKEKFCKFKDLMEGVDAGIRVGLAYTTLGVVSSPIEGFTHLKLGKTKEDKDYFVLYFSGPIRSAGGTASAFCLVIADYLRETLGYAKYDPTEDEARRSVIEMTDYHERINNLQYFPTEEEASFLAKNLPLQINGDASEDREVSNYKDLPRIETNFIRSGFCLVFAEGIAQKAAKIWKMVKKLREKGFKMSDWSFLEEFMKIHEKREKGKASDSPTYIKDLVAGRPVLGHPHASGAFRVRYGRTRTTGFSCLALHPATMQIMDAFIAVGSQLKIELPTKGATIASCDSIEGPIIKLRNGTVKKVQDAGEAKNYYADTEEIIYLGDILIPYGDYANRNHLLSVPGYTEQEWHHELRIKSKEKSIETDIENIYDVELKNAINISEKLDIPLHPKHIFYWSQIDKEDFLALVDWIAHGRYEKKIILPYNRSEKERFQKAKRALELIGAEHEVFIENVIISFEESQSIAANLGINLEGNFEEQMNWMMTKIEGEKSLDIINKLSKHNIRDKAGTFIGARMGRPEKAKLRKLPGSPNVLFPVGEEGGRLRSLNLAVETGEVKSDFSLYYCETCKEDGIYIKCDKCGGETKKAFICPECKNRSEGLCEQHGKGVQYSSRKVVVKDYFNRAVKKLDLLPSEIPSLIKGVKGTSNKNHTAENLMKGILRAKHGLQVNKDGTIRMDATEMPITHFKPKEIFVSIKKLREIGYTRDVNGKELENEEQILEIKPHDILLPCCPESKDEKADDVFMDIANFVDELLIRMYGLPAFYNIQKREDLVGHLVSCIAPHNCAGVAGRIIGFTKTQALLASPFMHAAMRRDCDGDEAAVMLLLDMLLNFSREFLPAHRGGTQDAPLVLNARIRGGEVDDMIFDFDVARELPYELYEKARQGEHPNKVKIEQVRDRLGKNEFDDLWYEYETSDLNDGVLFSNYKKLGSMKEKVEKEMELVERIRAAITSDVARLIIDRHFIRDIRGNLRKFSQQEFRCSSCNEKYRRPPLTGICTKCSGKIIFTISMGSIVKYLEPAILLATKYDIPAYMKQSLELTKSFIESIFGVEKEKQEDLKKWF